MCGHTYCCGSNTPPSKKFRFQKSKLKTMLILFLDGKEVIHHEYVFEDQTIKFSILRQSFGPLMYAYDACETGDVERLIVLFPSWLTERVRKHIFYLAYCKIIVYLFLNHRLLLHFYFFFPIFRFWLEFWLNLLDDFSGTRQTSKRCFS